MKRQAVCSILWHVLVGVSDEGRLLTVCYALREEDDEDTIRLISGRMATARERRQYAEGI